MANIPLKLKRLSDKAIVPTYGSAKSAGADLYSMDFAVLLPGERRLFKMGIAIAIPPGYYGRVAPRSGLACKDGIDVLAGVIDEDFRGEIGVILINLGQVEKNVFVGDKIAQLIFENYSQGDIEVVDNLDDTQRGACGFGSTGK